MYHVRKLNGLGTPCSLTSCGCVVEFWLMEKGRRTRHVDLSCYQLVHPGDFAAIVADQQLPLEVHCNVQHQEPPITVNVRTAFLPDCHALVNGALATVPLHSDHRTKVLGPQPTTRDVPCIRYKGLSVEYPKCVGPRSDIFRRDIMISA